MLDRLAADSMAAWYNRLLARESWARAALAPFAGRSARMDIGLISVCVAVAEGGTLVAGAQTPSVTIAITPQAIAGALWDRLAGTAAAPTDMRIDGDAAFAHALVDVLQKLQPDPAEDLSRIVGDAAAERIVGTVHAAMNQARDAGSRLARQGADYLVAENAMLLGAQEWEVFCADIAQMQSRLENLERAIAAAAGSRSFGQRG